MGDKRDRETRETREIDARDLFVEDRSSDPPTAVTDLSQILADLRGSEHWTVTVLSGSSSGLVVPITSPETVVGRGTDADIRIQDDGLSRKHAEFVQSESMLSVRDLGSTNGTFVEGKRITAETALSDGAWIQLASTAMRVNVRSEAETRTAQQLYESSVRDPLTDVYNRRHFDERIRSELAYAQRHRTPLSVLMIDADHFKRINDQHGHQAGDEVLRALAGLLSDSMRQEDIVARYGGEEFVVVLRAIDAAGADILAQRIRRRIEDLEIEWDDTTLRVTVSIGVATHSVQNPYADADALQRTADECLYRAKAAGRNVVVADATPRSGPPSGRPPS